MRRFAEVADAVAAQSGKLEKVASIAAYLRTLDDADLSSAARFFTGNAFAARDQRSLKLGARTVAAVAQRVWGFSRDALSASYRETGDLGAAIGPLVTPSNDLALFAPDPLSPSSLALAFAAIAEATGKHAGKRREAILERVLRACGGPLEAKYVVKIVTGDLRIGLRDGLVHEAIAAAFDAPIQVIRRAVMATGDVGAVASAARDRTLDHLHVAYGTPIGMMLASPIPYGERYTELGASDWIVEDKYDGIRAQAHLDGERVRIFSRTFNDVTQSYPEIARALGGARTRMILDGEIVAWRDGRALPFRTLQARLQRKEIDASLLADVPLRYVVFDALAIDEEFLIDEALLDRRARLIDALVPNEHVTLAPFQRLEAGTSPGDVNARFEAARARGNEGLMLKRTDAPYAPGRRGKWWLKLKRELSTLDVVVVAVEWGHGKRAKVLSDYTFAVRDEAGTRRTIGKAYSGLTDAEIAALTPWFLAHQTGRRGRALAVEPTVVIEVAFDIVQRSELHESGYALRFPRIVRIRDDKPSSEIDTLARVDEIYAEMLAREGAS
ncbi:MAG: ATP-dependent DNA ligase [bacterium]|nr:ATP-dependent DNA ligase [bacterium]